MTQTIVQVRKRVPVHLSKRVSVLLSPIQPYSSRDPA